MNKEKPLISVIVPVYKVEQYLHRCVDSILAQTYTNLEIILIDDGSPDRSGEICDEYAAKDSRIRVIHQENAGVSAARNAGLDVCSGEYIAFVDSDDYILPEMYEKMLAVQLEHQVDICVCQWQYEYEDGRRGIDPNKIDSNLYGKKTSIEFAEWSYRAHYEAFVVCAVWNKLYKRCIFDEVRFYGKRAEDERVHTEILSRNYSVTIISEFLYIYCRNVDSITHKDFDSNSLLLLDILKERAKLFQNNRFIYENTQIRYCELYISYYYQAQKNGIEMRDIKTFEKACIALFFSKRITVKFLIRMLIFRVCPTLYMRIKERSFR